LFSRSALNCHRLKGACGEWPLCADDFLALTVRAWPRVAGAARDLPAGDPLLRSACQLRCLATPVVLRDAWMARHALGVLNQQRRDSVHEVFRNVVKHPGP